MNIIFACAVQTNWFQSYIVCQPQVKLIPLSNPIVNILMSSKKDKVDWLLSKTIFITEQLRSFHNRLLLTYTFHTLYFFFEHWVSSKWMPLMLNIHIIPIKSLNWFTARFFSSWSETLIKVSHSLILKCLESNLLMITDCIEILARCIPFLPFIQFVFKGIVHQFFRWHWFLSWVRKLGILFDSISEQHQIGLVVVLLLYMWFSPQYWMKWTSS